MSKVRSLSLELFEHQVVRAACPVLVAFFAAACPVCRMVNPVLEELAQRYGEEARIASVDVHAVPELARKYDIRSVPTVLLFNAGTITHQFIGPLPKGEFVHALERSLLKKNGRP